MTIGSYGVNYPANTEVDVGANDMSAHVQSMAASCPNTKLVLGGYSLGAAAADVVVALNRPGFGFTESPAAGIGSARRRRRAVRQRHPAGARPGPQFQSSLRRQDHRPVRSR